MHTHIHTAGVAGRPPVVGSDAAGATAAASPAPPACATPTSPEEAQPPAATTARATERCVGDDYITYGNAQGLAVREVWEAYVHQHVLPTSTLHGALETNMEES